MFGLSVNLILFRKAEIIFAGAQLHFILMIL